MGETRQKTMRQPGLEPHDCENYYTCGAAVELPPGLEFDLLRWVDGGPTTWRVDCTGAAAAMLLQRGAPQSLVSFGLPALLDELDRAAGELRERLHGMTGYVAPAGAGIVSEQLGRRTRLRLVATGRLFTGASGGGQVRAIHLGGEHDERTQEAREGLLRRSRVQTAHKLVDDACKRLEEAHARMESANFAHEMRDAL